VIESIPPKLNTNTQVPIMNLVVVSTPVNAFFEVTPPFLIPAIANPSFVSVDNCAYTPMNPPFSALALASALAIRFLDDPNRMSGATANQLIGHVLFEDFLQCGKCLAADYNRVTSLHFGCLDNVSD